MANHDDICTRWLDRIFKRTTKDNIVSDRNNVFANGDQILERQ